MRAVVFDAIGTLVTPEPAAGVAYSEAGRRYGSRLAQPEVVRRFGAVFRETLRNPDREGDPHRTDEATERRFWSAVVSAVFDDLPQPGIEACFEDLLAHFAQPTAWRVYPDVAPTLRQLQSRGLKLAVASNFDRRLHAVFAGKSELAAIEHRFVSSEIGWRKPDRRFFAAVCEGLDSPADRILYVGDEPETDVAAATAAGMRSCLLARSGPTAAGVLTDLRELPPLLDQTSAGPLP